MGIRTISNNPKYLKAPDAKLTFSEGNYNRALFSYMEAIEWVQITGQANRKDMCGVINRPAHPESPAEIILVPKELLDEENWTLTVNIFCDTPEALEFLKSLDIPDNSRLEIFTKDEISHAAAK
jgi:hypothetical protein